MRFTLFCATVYINEILDNRYSTEVKMAKFFQLVNDWFWSEYFWLPPSASWENLRRNETTFYPDATDMLIPIPMAVGLFVARLLWERYLLSCALLIINLYHRE